MNERERRSEKAGQVVPSTHLPQCFVKFDDSEQLVSDKNDPSELFFVKNVL